MGGAAYPALNRLGVRQLLVVLASVVALMISLDPVRAAVGGDAVKVEGAARNLMTLFSEGPLDMSPDALRSILSDPSGAPRPIVVIAPHMDDETLFCGETITALREQGFEVTVVFTTTSQGGRKMDPRFEADRHGAYWEVAPVLGVSRTFISEIPDGAPLGGERAKAELTQAYVVGTGAVTPDCVLFTIGGGGQYDHRIAEFVGRRMAREVGVPLFIYWGYGPRGKWHPASDKNWGPDMRPADIAGPYAQTAIERKRQAIEIYKAMYYTRGWTHYWVSIGRFEEHHRDEVGYVSHP